MFRKKNSTAIIALSLILLLMVQPAVQTFASVQTSRNSLLQRANDELNPYDDVEPLTKPLELGNIYDHAYDLASKAQASTALQTITATTRDFNVTYSCDLVTDDMVALFLGVDAIRQDLGSQLASVAEIQNLNNQSASFTTACLKTTACIQKKSRRSTERLAMEKGGNALTLWRTNNLTDTAYNACRNYAFAAYQKTSSIISNMTSLSTTAVGNDIYYNGTLDDSPFDLLVDIQAIGDILFAQNEKTDSMLFYTFPNGKVRGAQVIQPGNISPTTAQPSSYTPTTSQNTNSSSPTQSATPATTTPTAANTIDTDIWEINSTQADIEDTVSTLPSSPTNTVAIDAAATSATDDLQNYACTPWEVILPTITGSVSSSTSSTISQSNSSTSTSSSTLTVNFNQPYVSPIGNPPTKAVTSGATSSNLSLPSTDPINDTSWEAPSDYEVQTAKINSCLDGCKNMGASDKALCSAKCMCGTSYSKNGIFGISICTVPGRQQDISRNKSVMSIQEILTELNTVLTKLKESGEMIKHVKTKELLDTWLRKIKLGKIFNFDLNVTFKPMIDNKPRKKQKAEEQTETDKQLKWDLGNIEIAAERNKYVTLRDHTAQSSLTREAYTTASFADNASAAQTLRTKSEINMLTPAISNALAKSQNAEVTSLIAKFIEENARFWSSMHDVLEGIAATSDSIRQKIEKGK